MSPECKRDVVALIEQYYALMQYDDEAEDPINEILSMFNPAMTKEDEKFLDAMYDCFRGSGSFGYARGEWDEMAKVEIEWLGDEVRG